MIFENIIGNEKNKKLLEDIITKNKIANAYMFIIVHISLTGESQAE